MFEPLKLVWGCWCLSAFQTFLHLFCLSHLHQPPGSSCVCLCVVTWTEASANDYTTERCAASAHVRRARYSFPNTGTFKCFTSPLLTLRPCSHATVSVTEADCSNTVARINVGTVNFYKPLICWKCIFDVLKSASCFGIKYLVLSKHGWKNVPSPC